MDLNTIRGKENKDVTEEERKLLDAAKDQLSTEERDKFYPEESEAAKKAAADKEAADKAAADAAAAAAAKKPAGVAASEGMTQIDASELETLRTNAAAGLEASEKLKRTEAENTVTEMFFSEPDGVKLPTDMKSKVTDLWLDASEEQRETIKKMAENSKPILDANDRTNLGTNQGGGQGDAQSLLEDKVTELSASEAYKDKPYAEVLKAARAQNPDLAKEADLEESRGMAGVSN